MLLLERLEFGFGVVEPRGEVLALRAQECGTAVAVHLAAPLKVEIDQGIERFRRDLRVAMLERQPDDGGILHRLDHQPVVEGVHGTVERRTTLLAARGRIVGKAGIHARQPDLLDHGFHDRAIVQDLHLGLDDPALLHGDRARGFADLGAQRVVAAQQHQQL